MRELTAELIEGKIGNEPLIAFPWKDQADRLIQWSQSKSEIHRAFAFDLLISLAYIDTTSSLPKNLVYYEELPNNYRLHMGFINLCSPLLIESGQWHYQKAAKPKSGVIGKLTSEVILRFIKIIFTKLEVVKSLGGVGIADAVIQHQDGRIILCEIKASPLTTFPLLFTCPEILRNQDPTKFTRTQVEQLESGIYTHGKEIIPLGQPKNDLWPFKPAVDYITNTSNSKVVETIVERWNSIKIAYQERNRESNLYYISNASGHPPKIAKEKFNWPERESISDSKTSAGLDRTDDIKKGIYQTFKLSIEANRHFELPPIKTAIISNLPAYRHGEEYIEPFYDIYWGYENSFIKEESGRYSCTENDLKRPFDYIISLEDAFLRGDIL